jgi:hypothetical protein
LAITPTEFKVRFPEFASEADATIQVHIDRAELRLHLGTWGDLYDEGLYYLTAHYLSKALETAAGGGTGAGASGALTSKKIGDVALTFGSHSSSSGLESYYLSTPYGQEFWSMAMIVSQTMGVVSWSS